MSLDPQAARVVAALERDGLLASPTMTAAEMRAAAATRTRPAGEPVADVADLTVPGPAGDVGVRLYRPADHAGALAVYFHGGGWVMGDLDTQDARCRTLANRSGCSILAVDYRLAPEHPFPAAFDDAVAVVRWAAASAAKVGCGPNRLAVLGDSAGGNLAAAAALDARNRGIDLRLQVLVYPVLHAGPDHLGSYAAQADGPVLTRPLMEWFLDTYAGRADRRDWRLAPFHAPDLREVAPALIITAGLDPLRDEAEEYGVRLAEAGVAVDSIRYQRMFHGFLGFPDEIDAAVEALDRIGAALRAAMQ